MATSAEILALHRYFIWADVMRKQFEQDVQRGETSQNLMMYPHMSYYYGGMFVLIEGWRELRLSDPAIDGLLANATFVDKLKRYRHGSFHFQSDYFDERFLEFFGLAGAPAWIRSLRNAFSDWFLTHFNSKGVTP